MQTEVCNLVEFNDTMFNKLREKIKNWTKKLSEKSGKEAEEKEEPEKELEVPMKFNEGLKKYEPDLEQLKEKAEKLEEKERKEKKHKKEKIIIREEPEPEEEEETRNFFRKIKEKITKVKVSEKDFSIYAEELETLLLENNVALEVADKMIKELKERVVGKEFLKKEVEGMIEEIFKDVIYEILIEPFNIADRIKIKNSEKKEPYVILFCGINGSGKTTTIAKIAEHLKKNRISSVIAAADTFRAASIEQIKKHGDRIGVKVISHDYGTDPASVGFDAVKYAKKNFIECVLIDTAGRMHTAKNLLKEIEKISNVCKPDLKIFVGESITGNDAVEQVKNFNEAIGIDGIVLTKADIDEKGGTALSIGYITKKPILYLGTGQEYEAIEVFDRKKFTEKLGL